MSLGGYKEWMLRNLYHLHNSSIRGQVGGGVESPGLGDGSLAFLAQVHEEDLKGAALVQGIDQRPGVSP